MCISHYVKFYRHVTLQRISWQNSVFEDYKSLDLKKILCVFLLIWLFVSLDRRKFWHYCLTFMVFLHVMNICMFLIYTWEDVTAVFIFLIAGVGCQRAPKAGCSAVVREQEAKHLNKWPHQHPHRKKAKWSEYVCWWQPSPARSLYHCTSPQWWGSQETKPGIQIFG